MSTPVLVTTERGGVYFGYMADDTPAPVRLDLTDARVVVRWDTGGLGFLALAVQGPGGMADISPAAPSITLYGIASIAVCTPAAATDFDNA